MESKTSTETRGDYFLALMILIAIVQRTCIYKITRESGEGYLTTNDLQRLCIAHVFLRVEELNML